MGRVYESIDDRLAGWMERQPVFFVATAPMEGDGHVNCSPKGNRDEFKVLDEHRVAYLEQTGSGVETIAHLRQNGRIVVMFCAFEGPPRIVRVHGTGRAVLVRDPDFEAVSAPFRRDHMVAVRSVIVIDAARISDSCGYGVPQMVFSEHRSNLQAWADRKGHDGVVEYWAERNTESLDGLVGVPAPPAR